MPRRPLALALSFVLLTWGVAGRVCAQGGGWMQRPGLLDADGFIYDLIVYDGELVAAGDFEHIGGVEAGGLAAFDGQRWRPLGDPLRLLDQNDDPLNAWAEIMTVFRGDLIVAGRFSNIGDARAMFIARWDGTQLKGLEIGTNGRVASLAVHQDQLILGGFFTQAGGVPVERVARFTRSFEPMDNGFKAGVTALGSHGDHVWAGGLFSNSGIRSTPHIARWIGGAWEGIEPGFASNDGDPAAVFGFGEYQGELIALGHFHSFGSTRTNGIARWDGQTWQSFAGGLGGSGMLIWGSDLVEYAGELYVSGQFQRAGVVAANNVARYDGSQWWPLAAGTNGDVKAMAVFQGELYLAGIFTRANNQPAGHLAVWRVASTPPPRPTNLSLGVYPNPARGVANLRIELPEPGEVELLLTDLRGRLLRSQRIHLSGTTLDLPLAGNFAPVASGRYLLTMRVGDQELTRSFVVQR